MTERILRAVIIPVAAVAFAVALGMFFLWLGGYPAMATFKSILEQSFRNWYGFGQVLRTTTLLIFTGLAVALAFHAGLFNIGVEGQLYMGSVAAAITGYYVGLLPANRIGGVPWVMWFALFTLVAMLAGGLWAAIPGVLKAVTGAHEVITTIMMNFIAFAFINYLLRPEEGSFAVPATRHTPGIPQSLRLAKLSEVFPVFKGSTVSYALVIALVAVVAVQVILRFTRKGFEIRAVGKNALASRLAGIYPKRIIVLTMFASGALAGLVGVEFVLAYRGYFEEGFSGGLGFVGIAVALLANNNPIGIIFTAFLFAVLNYGKVAAAGQVPKDTIEVMQAAIIFCVIIGNKLFARALVWAKKRAIARAAEGTDSLTEAAT